MNGSQLTTALVLAAATSTGCASRYQAGQALVASGTVVAVIASELATDPSSRCQYAQPCAAYGGSTSQKSGAAAAGVAAGVALAAVGSVLQESDTPPHAKRSQARPAASPP